MKRIIYTFILLWAVLSATYSQNVASLVVTFANGTTTSCELDTRPRVTSVNGSVKIASPTVNFNVDETVSATTGAASNVTMGGATLAGTGNGASVAKNTVSIGVVYNTTGAPTVNNGVRVASGRTANGDFTVTLKGLVKNTTYYYCTYIAVDGVYYYGTASSFTTKKKSDAPTPGDAIDLGLSVKWASHNVGATSPEGCGGYYAWGETAEKSTYTWETYPYYNSSTGFVNIGSNISGTPYDVAHVSWGGSWRMPTHEEMQELCSKCTYMWIICNGVLGMKFTGPNGNSIFLPAAGSRWGTAVNNRGTYGYYWLDTVYSGYSNLAWSLLFFSDYAGPGGLTRSAGFSVRPVSE